jgi:hypothetical protein
MEKYSIVWQEQKDGGEWLPFFIWGDTLTAFEYNGTIEVNEDNLLKGILYELYAPPKFPVKRERLINLLDIIRDTFRYDSLEYLILDAAADTRFINGNVPSQIMLEAGSKLMPDSTKIKDDLANDMAINEIDIQRA